MLGFGKKKDDDDKDKAEQAQIGQAMRSMSDQIASQAQKIKQLEDQLDDAKDKASDSDDAADKLREAQAELRKMKLEMARVKAEAAKDAAEEAKSSASSGGLGVGVTKIGPKADSPAAAPAAEEPAGGLRIGGTAYVQKAGGKNLRRRSAPGLDSDVIDGLAPGTQMTLLAGPVDDDGYPWWQIRTSDGREGWVAGTELVTSPE